MFPRFLARSVLDGWFDLTFLIYGYIELKEGCFHHTSYNLYELIKFWIKQYPI